MNSAQNVMGRLATAVINPALLIIFALGLFLFIWGLVEFLWKLNRGGDTSEGKQHMLWGLLGMLIMISAYSIIALATGTFGIDYRNPDTGALDNINVSNGFFGR